MAVYKFRVRFEDDDYEDVIRDIEIKPSSTFDQFHFAILDAIGFDHEHLASFYMSNDNWKKGYEITLMDMGEGDGEPKAMMSDIKISSVIEDPHQKFIYVYDFIEMWTLHVELISLGDEKPGVQYPQLVRSEGDAPKQYKQQPGGFEAVGDDEFGDIAKKLLGGEGLDLDDDDDSDDEDGEDSINDEISNDFDELSGGFDEDDTNF